MRRVSNNPILKVERVLAARRPFARARAGVSVGGALTNNAGGRIDIGNTGLGASSTLTASGLTNSGTINLVGSSTVNAAKLTTNGPTSNSGIANIGAFSNLTVTGAANSYAQIGGTTNVFANGTLTAPNVNVTGGTLQGNGTIAGNLNVSAAGTAEAINPSSNTAATLTVNGGYNQTGGTLAALLQGTSASQIGQVHLTNGTPLNLNAGNLQSAPGSISYATGQVFSNVVTFQPGQLFGTFSQLQGLGNGVSANLGGGLTLEALYNNAAGNITLQVVNTPGSNTIIWNDGTGNWQSDTAKWTPNGPPVPTSDVVIGGTNTGNVTLSNDATINTLQVNNANQLTVNGGSTLTVATGANSVNVQSGGGITLGGSLNTLGTVTVASGGSLGLSGGTIIDATLAGPGSIQTNTSGTLHAVTVSNGTTFTGLNGTSTTLVGTITNNGTIAQSSTGSTTDFHISGGVTLTGNGTFQLSNSVNNRVYASGSDSLTIDTNQKAAGAGQFGINNGGFGFALDNKGTINANQSGGTLQVAPTQTVTNTGTMEASNGGILHLLGGYANGGGLILGTGANSTVEVAGATITGGTLTTTSGGAVQNTGGATLDGVTISAGSTVTAANASATTLQNTITISNTGALAESSTGSLTDMPISGPVTLTGGGTLSLSNNFNNRIYGVTGNAALTNDVTNTIAGAGQLGINNGGFGFALDNKGTINASQSGGTLQVAPTQTVTNTGTMEASNGGTLHLLGSFANTGGLILGTGTNSTVELAGSAIHGGTLTTASGGAVQNTGTTATLDGVTISGGSTVTAANGSATTLQNTITISNAATLAQSSSGSLTDLHISGSVILTGGGALALSNSANNRIYGSGTDTLTNDVNNTIQGAGQLGINSGGFAFNLDNKGTILANKSAALQVAPAAPVTNEASGVLEANGGTLALIGTFNNSGLIEGLGGSVVQIGGATINGGNLDGQVANNGSATVNGVTIKPTGTLTGLNGTSTTLAGTIINNGTIAQSSTGSLTDFHISGNVTLNGTGTFQLSDNGNNRIFAGGSDRLDHRQPADIGRLGSDRHQQRGTRVQSHQ
jgi:hypothetical protein